MAIYHDLRAQGDQLTVGTVILKYGLLSLGAVGIGITAGLTGSLLKTAGVVVAVFGCYLALALVVCALLSDGSAQDLLHYVHFCSGEVILTSIAHRLLGLG